MAKKPKHRTDAVAQVCEMLIAKGQRERTWAGFVQSFTRVGGRPYCKEQVAVLIYMMKTDHLQRRRRRCT